MTNKYSNLLARVAVALIAIPAILFCCYKGGVFFFLFVTAISLFALHEFFDLATHKGASVQRVTGTLGALAILLAFFHEQIQFFILPFFISCGGVAFLTKLQLFVTVYFLFLVFVLLIELFRNKGSVFLNAGFTIFGVSYIGICLGTLLGIRELFGMEFPLPLAIHYFKTATPLSDDVVRSTTYAWGGLTIIGIFASVWMCDTAAYFGGISMGTHKLFPRVSPGKTWEGAVWGFFGAVATMILFAKYFLPYLQLHQAIIIGIIIGVFGQIGDLVESLFKRDAGVKDSSSILPGHGGIFDRFDSLIFVSPILYLYIDFVVLS